MLLLDMQNNLTSHSAYPTPRCRVQGHSLKNILHTDLKVGVEISLLHGKPIAERRALSFAYPLRSTTTTKDKIYTEAAFEFNVGLIVFFQK